MEPKKKYPREALPYDLGEMVDVPSLEQEDRIRLTDDITQRSETGQR